LDLALHLLVHPAILLNVTVDVFLDRFRALALLGQLLAESLFIGELFLESLIFRRHVRVGHFHLRTLARQQLLRDHTVYHIPIERGLHLVRHSLSRAPALGEHSFDYLLDVRRIDLLAVNRGDRILDGKWFGLPLAGSRSRLFRFWSSPLLLSRSGLRRGLGFLGGLFRRRAVSCKKSNRSGGGEEGSVFHERRAASHAFGTPARGSLKGL